MIAQSRSKRTSNSADSWGRISPHFSKPTAAFIGDALFGIQASGEVKLASWVKLLNCRAKPKKAEDRLSRHLSLEGMDRKLQRIVMEDSRGKVHDDTPIVIDPTDICKAGARKMEYLYTVRGGNRSRSDANPELVNRYTGCMAVAQARGRPPHVRAARQVDEVRAGRAEPATGVRVGLGLAPERRLAPRTPVSARDGGADVRIARMCALFATESRARA